MSMEKLFILWLLAAGMGATLWVGVKIGRYLGAILYACVAATSFTRFAWACGKEHGFRELRYPRWMHAPVVWGDIFLTLLGAAKGSVSHYGGAGVWNGIGEWTVFPAAKGGQGLSIERCECHRCIKEKGLTGEGVLKLPLSSTKMILCPICGNKRCPHASDHDLPCTDSNDPGQAGSIYQ